MLKANGDKGDANDAVIKALVDAGMLIARARLKHQYPHSWRSKKPVIFRNTPQWFIHMDKKLHFPSPPASGGEGGGMAAGQAGGEGRPLVGRLPTRVPRAGRKAPKPRLRKLPPLTLTLSPSKRGEGMA